MFKTYIKLLFLIVYISLTACKKGDSKLDLLIGGGGSSFIEEVEITSSSPEDTNVSIEIGESKNFIITAVAPIPNVVSYNWTLDGENIPAVNSYIVTGDVSNVGQHTLIATASDGETTQQKIWEIKVNGPPVVNKITQGVPKISFEASSILSVSASDPNDDTLTFRWLLNGVESPFLVGSNENATLTGNMSLIGENSIVVEVSDGSQIQSQNWIVEVNYFPQACNELLTGQICTYAGGAHKGSGLDASNTLYPLRFRPFAHIQDAIGNIFISDLDNNVVWYWNKTS
jgi:hypothetical protein